MSKVKKGKFDTIYFANNPAEWDKFKLKQATQRNRYIELRDYLTELILSKGKNLKFSHVNKNRFCLHAFNHYQTDKHNAEDYIYSTFNGEVISIEVRYKLNEFGDLLPVKKFFEKVLMILQDLNYRTGFSTAIEETTDLMVKKLNGKNLDEKFLTLEDLREVSFILDQRDYFKKKSDTKHKWSDTIKKVQSIIDENLRNGKFKTQRQALDEWVELGTDRTINLELKSNSIKNIKSNIIRDMTR